MARDSFDYSLSMDDRDQPAKVLLDYMSGFNYQVDRPRHGASLSFSFSLHQGCATATVGLALHCICTAGSENMGGLPSAHVQVSVRQSRHTATRQLSSAAQSAGAQSLYKCECCTVVVWSAL